MNTKKNILSILAALFLFILAASPAFADEINSGDTAWILVSSALVLLMTPGLAFFYGGLVGKKNVISTMFQSYIALPAVGLLWFLVGYSLAFGQGNAFVGGLEYLALQGVGMEASGTIPHSLFMAFQGMFAIITTALMTGSFAGRVSFKAWMWFAALWSLVVYAPIAHWVWGGGWISGMGGLDFAGGLVVHMSAGFSALVAALVFGKGAGYGKSTKMYNVGWVLLGTALLWFGWFGFNAGSALAADGLAAHAFTTTFIASVTALLVWAVVDKMKNGKMSAAGAGVGAVAGLVAITPASGFVGFQAALLIGALAGVICNLVAGAVKKSVDDTLDVFACHGIGGLIGVVCTGLFAEAAIGGTNGLLFGGQQAFIANLAGAAGVIVWSMVATFILLKIVNVIAPLRVSSSDESTGLDKTQHGEVVDSN